MKGLLKVATNGQELKISVSKEALVFACNNSPHNMLVCDEHSFMIHVAEYLNYEHSETGLTLVQALFDKVFEMIMDNEDCILPTPNLN